MFDFMRYPRYFGQSDQVTENVTAESIAIAAAQVTILQFNQACETVCNEAPKKTK